MKQNIINYLGICRKDTPITQSDMAALMDLQDNSLISRCESNVRMPSIEMTLVYHLLFDIPLATFVSTHREAAKERLIVRMRQLIEQLLQRPTTSKVEWRINYLTRAQTRLSEEQRHGK